MFITRIRPHLVFSTGEAPGGGTEGLAPEGAPETTVDTPAVEAGTGTTDQPQVPQENWEDRYKEAQGWGTRNAQRVSELEPIAQRLEAAKSGDREAQQWLLDQVGLQLAEDDQLDDADTPPAAEYAPVDPSIVQRLEAFEAHQTQQEQAQQQQQFEAAVQAEYDPLIKDMGVPEQFVDAVRNAALNMPLLPSPQGERLDLDGAWNGIKEFLLLGQHVPDVSNTLLENYRKTKRAPQVASGGAGTQVPSLDTSQNRVKFMMDRAAQMGD